MWGRPSSDCSRTCSRSPAATRATISSPVSSAFGYALVAALGNVVGALAVTRRAAGELALIEHFVAFGAGFMLAVALVEVLPEAFARSGPAAPALVLAGYLAVHFTQHTLTPHFHFGEETHAVNRVAGTSAVVGLLLHTFFDGVAIASAFLVRPALGLMVFIAIFLHKLPEGVTIASLYIAVGRSGRQAVAAAAAPGGGAPVGGGVPDPVGLLGPDGLALAAAGEGVVAWCIFGGPRGSGKPARAGIAANSTDRHFEPFSAVTEGVARVREIIKAAEERLKYEGRGTILFCDEIHRFNRAQQDAFLPWVENGIVTLIGATTENPSFELTGALLSRCRVFVLEPLTPEHIKTLVRRALEDKERGIGTSSLEIEDDALALLAREADGDARRALQAIEAAAEYLVAHPGSRITHPVIVDALQKRFAKSDKSGEEHFNLISALHKAVRGSDVEGSLYWLARMLAGGQDPLYIARRLVRIAAEDIGLADPRALSLTLAAKDAYHFLGSPEGELALAQATVYLATAPKSNRVYTAFAQAMDAAAEHPAEAVPLHIRNAPTKLMEELGYGAGYKYAHAFEHAYVPQEYLPEVLRGASWYEPSEVGYEKTIAERMEFWRQVKERIERETGKGKRET